MTAKVNTPRIIYPLLALFAFIAIAPLIFFDFGGDIIFQYVMIDCFGHSFWTGNLYPRWCFDANVGLGAPLFVFYSPLPYYISTLFYPLMHWGVPILGIYLCCLWLSTIVTGLTAYSWLREITTPTRALIGMTLYLYVPYRMEVMLFRAAYAELWCLAWLPLVFKYTRAVMRQRRGAVPMLALSFGLCFITHMPCAVIGVLASGCYILVMAFSERSLERLFHYGFALVWGAALSAFYLGPAVLYKRFITTEGVISGNRSWSNTYLSMDNILVHGQGHVVTAIGISLVVAFGLMYLCLKKRDAVEDPFAREEVIAWTIILVIASFLLFPISSVVWDHLGFIAMLAFPWRMQSAIALALVYFFTLRLQWFLSAKQRKTARGDAVVGFGMLLLLSLFLVSSPIPDFVQYGDEMIKSHFSTQREYRTIWTDKHFITRDYVFDRYRHRDTLPKIVTLSGDAKTSVGQWDQHAILLHVHAKQSSVLKMDLQYFPTWVVSGADGITLTPEASSGRMLAHIPAGNYDLILRSSIHALGLPMYVFDAASILALALFIISRKRIPARAL